MSNPKNRIPLTEVPIIGKGGSWQDTIQALVNSMNQAFMSIAKDIFNINARLDNIEKESFRRVNVYINPKEPDMKETVSAVYKAVSDLLEPSPVETNNDSTSKDIKEE